MRLFTHLPLRSLLLVPFLAFALASPVSAETSSNPPSAQNGASPASEAEAPVEQAEVDPAAEPGTGSAAVQPEANTTPEKVGSQILINIDKSRQEMTVFVDGIEKYTWPVSTGKRGYSTPSGDYAPTSMNKIWYSKEWDNAPMPHSIFYMKDGHAIHGSNEIKNLGKPASHGCVRLAPKNASVLFDLVKANGMENTKVILAGVSPGGESKVVATKKQPYPRDADAGAWVGPGYYPPPGWQRRRGYDPRYGDAPPWFRGNQRRRWFRGPGY